MKAKSSLSFVEKTYSRGAIALFGGVAIFLAGFAVWSASCIGGACFNFIKNLV